MGPYIKIVQPNGTVVLTSKRVGSLDERDLYTVITEKWGKLFFDSRKNYFKWKKSGRRKNMRTGRFPRANDTYRLRQSDMIGDGDGEVGGEEDSEHIVVEEYTVDEYDETGECEPTAEEDAEE